MPATLSGDYTKYPESIRKVIPLIAGEVCILRQAWTVYSRLFMEHKPRTEAFVRCAGELLGVLQTLLQDQMLLSVSRLTDRDTKDRANLSLWKLVEAAPEAGDEEFTNEMQSELENLYQAAKAVRKHRNKRIAHFDLEVSVSKSTLPTVKFAELRSLIERIETFVNRFNRVFQNCTTLFDFLTAHEVTGGFETVIAKSLAYDNLEAKGVVPKLSWINSIV